MTAGVNPLVFRGSFPETRARDFQPGCITEVVLEGTRGPMSEDWMLRVLDLSREYS